MNKNIIAIILLIIIIAGATFFLLPKPVEPPFKVNITTSEQPGDIGRHYVYLTSDRPFNATVFVDDQQAYELNSTGLTKTFTFFVTAYEDLGVKQIKVNAKSNGKTFYSESQGFEVGYNAGADIFNDTMFYSYEFYPGLKIQELMRNNKEINFFYEALEGEADVNKDIINSFIPLVFRLGQLNKTVHIYLVETKEFEWTKCVDENYSEPPVEECKQVFEKGPSIILRLPVFISSQVKVTNTTIEMEPMLGELKQTVGALLTVINSPPLVQIVFPGKNTDTSSPETVNATNTTIKTNSTETVNTTI